MSESWAISDYPGTLGKKARAEPYDLAALYEQRWVAPHRPWHVFLRMLDELYGAEIEEEAAARSRSHLGLSMFRADGVGPSGYSTAVHAVVIADEVGLGETFLASVTTTYLDRLSDNIRCLCGDRGERAQARDR